MNSQHFGLWIALGAGVGVALGTAFGNPGIGVALGAGVGLAFGSAMQAMRQKKEQDEDKNEDL